MYQLSQYCVPVDKISTTIQVQLLFFLKYPFSVQNLLTHCRNSLRGRMLNHCGDCWHPMRPNCASYRSAPNYMRWQLSGLVSGHILLVYRLAASVLGMVYITKLSFNGVNLVRCNVCSWINVRHILILFYKTS